MVLVYFYVRIYHGYGVLCQKVSVTVVRVHTSMAGNITITSVTYRNLFRKFCLEMKYYILKSTIITWRNIPTNVSESHIFSAIIIVGFEFVTKSFCFCFYKRFVHN